MGQVQLTISLIMIALFAVAIIGFGIAFASDNNAPISIGQDSGFAQLNTNLNGNLSSFSSEADSQYHSILGTTIAPGSQTAQSAAPFAITPENAIGSVISILKTAYVKIFGSSAGFGIFSTALIGTLIFLFGLFLYRTLRGFVD